MAEASISVDQFRCSVCLDLLKDPVAIPCGHSYCMSCITNYWNHDDRKKVYSCPQCRQTFSPRPVLVKNIMLTEVVEKLKKTKLQVVVSADCSAVDVLCDVCTEIKHKAVKSCLMCLNSYCQDHLQQHEDLFKEKKHILIEATGRLKAIICPQHDRPLDIYCRTDQRCVCYLCTMNEHKNHDTVSAVAQRTDLQKILFDTKKKYPERIEQIEKELKKMRESLECYKGAAQMAVDDTERIITYTVRCLERRLSEVTKVIRDQEKTTVSQIEEHLKGLEEEIYDLRRRDTEIDELSHTQDHIAFIQSFQSLYLDCKEPRNTFTSKLSVGYARDYISKLNYELEEFWKEVGPLYPRVPCSEVTPINEPKTRQEFLQYYLKLTVDTNTVSKYLRLSDRNRQISWSSESRAYPDHPDRFDKLIQVMCKEIVTGRCYWEVEWSFVGMSSVSVSVSYGSIKRKGRGRECQFGNNKESWSFSRHISGSTFTYDHMLTNFPQIQRFSKVGVYVDHSAGIMAFYRVSDTMTLIHRVQTTFTQPLYAGFQIWGDGKVKLCEL